MIQKIERVICKDVERNAYKDKKKKEIEVRITKKDLLHLPS